MSAAIKRILMVRTVGQYVADSYNKGEMTLKEAARELCLAGWTNFVDEDYTRGVIERYTQI